MTLVEGLACDLEISEGRVAAMRLADGPDARAGAVVLATGTFLNGVIHIGDEQHSRRPHG